MILLLTDKQPTRKCTNVGTYIVMLIYEETLPDGTIRVQGLLIDFDYAIRVDESGRTAGPGDRTVSLADQLFSKSHST